MTELEKVNSGKARILIIDGPDEGTMLYMPPQPVIYMARKTEMIKDNMFSVNDISFLGMEPKSTKYIMASRPTKENGIWLYSTNGELECLRYIIHRLIQS